MHATDFLGVSTRCPSFASVVKRYAGTMLALVAQSAACNRAHDTDARCARWLLMTHDQVGADTFPITQEFLAQMLGVTRPQTASATTALTVESAGRPLWRGTPCVYVEHRDVSRRLADKHARGCDVSLF